MNSLIKRNNSDKIISFKHKVNLSLVALYPDLG